MLWCETVQDVEKILIDILLAQVEQVLQTRTDGLSEFEMLKAIKALPDSQFEGLDMQDAHSLFRAHFLLFHCLYRLRDQRLAQQSGNLQIDVLCIRVLPYHSKMSDELAVVDQVRDYYLDWSHFEQATADEAEELINQFWQKFLAQDDRSEALKTLELADDAGFDQIKQQYRQLAMKNHPDRGGSATRLAAINRAMDTLKRYYR